MSRGLRSSRNRASIGDHNVISDDSGFKFKSSEMRRGEGLQEGLLVHESEWSPENPQLHIRVRPDDQTVEETRLRGPDKFQEDVASVYQFADGGFYQFADSSIYEFNVG